MAHFLGRKFVVEHVESALKYLELEDIRNTRRKLKSILNKLANNRQGRKQYKSKIDKRPAPPAKIYES
jgi:hypothetical protein